MVVVLTKKFITDEQWLEYTMKDKLAVAMFGVAVMIGTKNMM